MRRANAFHLVVVSALGLALGQLAGCGSDTSASDGGAPDRLGAADGAQDSAAVSPGDAPAPLDASAADAGLPADTGGGGGCGPIDTAAVRTLQLTANSAAELTGALIGAGVSTIERKKVALRVERTVPSIALGEAFLIRTDRTEVTYLVMEARNTGTATSCFIRASSYSWRSADETVLSGDGPDFLFLAGAVGDVTSPTNTCLAPGDVGYFLDLRNPLPNRPLFTAVTTVVMSLDNPIALDLVGASLLPTNYSASSCATARELTVELENAGTIPLVPDLSFAKALFLDGEGLPLGWSFLNPPGTAAPLAPGARLSVPVDLPFQPMARRLRVYTRFVIGP